MPGTGGSVGVPAIEGGPAVDALAETVEDAGRRARVDDIEALREADLEFALAPGPTGLRRLAAAGVDAPLLPVDVGEGFESVPFDRLAAAVGRPREESSTNSHVVLGVSVDGTSERPVLRDVSLVTEEPARISEFAIESAVLGAIDDVRADGVVVATPAGSHGYASAGDGPILAPGTGVAVVPVAPFQIEPQRWVLPAAELSIQVCRDEAAVSIVVDGHETATVGGDATVALRPRGTFDVRVVPESTPLSE